MRLRRSGLCKARMSRLMLVNTCCVRIRFLLRLSTRLLLTRFAKVKVIMFGLLICTTWFYIDLLIARWFAFIVLLRCRVGLKMNYVFRLVCRLIVLLRKLSMCVRSRLLILVSVLNLLIAKLRNVSMRLNVLNRVSSMLCRVNFRRRMRLLRLIICRVVRLLIRVNLRLMSGIMVMFRVGVRRLVILVRMRIRFVIMMNIVVCLVNWIVVVVLRMFLRRLLLMRVVSKLMKFRVLLLKFCTRLVNLVRRLVRHVMNRFVLMMVLRLRVVRRVLLMR